MQNLSTNKQGSVDTQGGDPSPSKINQAMQQPETAPLKLNSLRSVSRQQNMSKTSQIRSVRIEPSALAKMQGVTTDSEGDQPAAQPEPEPKKKSVRKLNSQEVNLTRKGVGITGLGVSNIHAHLSGRLTMGMLVKMQQMREEGAVQFTLEKDNEFDQTKLLLDKLGKLKEEKRAYLRDSTKVKPEIIELNLKRMKKDKMRLKQQVIMNMKDKFKHIYGMWPATAHFVDEHHRMEAWQTSLVIKRKIFDPSKCLI